ncbi:MAG: ribokinase [Anaerolineales bacterium]|nr:MAG: ribokinase [Anaerolineales bacterium]
MVELDYLVIGHATNDLVGGTLRIGGTVVYAARTALAFGCRVGVVTSARADLDLASVLAGVATELISADATTTFENVYTAEGRRQVIHGVAGKLAPGVVPAAWQARIVHLGPVAQELDPRLAKCFGSAFLGLTPQGWMRRWDSGGQVGRTRWKGANPLLRRADAVVLSDEDVRRSERLLRRYAGRTRALVVTRAAAGGSLYSGGSVRHFAGADVTEVDPTGAGDIFAAAFFISLQRTGDAWQAARLANCLAARSVTRPGLDGVPNADEVARCERDLLVQRV